MRVCCEGVTAAMSAKLGLMFAAPASLKELVRAAANAHLWVHTRSAFLSG